MDEINFENFTKSLQTEAPQGKDGDLQVKRMLKTMQPAQLWLIKTINDNELKFAIGVLGLSYKEVIQTLRLQADMLEKVVKICEDRL